MKRFGVYLFLLLQLTINGVVMAQERLPGDWELTIWQLSKHLDPPPEGHSYNEVNPGLGIRRFFAKRECWEIFADANHIGRNSTGGSATLAGVGGQCAVLSKGHFDIVLGGVAGVVRYENEWWKDTYVTLGAYPYVGLRHRNTTIIMGYLPSYKEAYQTLFAYGTIKF